MQAVVLAFMIDRPRYGYEIASRVEHGIAGSFLPLDRGAVYSALQSLERMGYVTAIERNIERRMTKRRCDTRRWHQATTQGRDAHRRWVTGRLMPEPERVEILSRMTSAARVGPLAVRMILNECEQYCNDRERALNALDAIQMLDTEYPNLSVLCDRLVLAECKIALRGLREWVQVARDEVDTFVQQQANPDIERMQRPDHSVRC